MTKPKIVTDSIKDQIYEILKDEIITLKLKSGEKLVEQAIANRLNVSRSPVREAIKQLTGDGLVVNITNKGSYVKRPSLKELADLQEARQILEVFAIRKVTGHLSETEKNRLVKLREKIQKSKSESSRVNYLNLERTLWISIIKMTNNSYIIENYCKLYATLESFRVSVLTQKPDSFDHSITQRVQIIDFILEGNVEAAVEMTEKHLQNAIQILHEAIESSEKQA